MLLLYSVGSQSSLESLNLFMGRVEPPFQDKFPVEKMPRQEKLNVELLSLKYICIHEVGPVFLGPNRERHVNSPVIESLEINFFES